MAAEASRPSLVMCETPSPLRPRNSRRLETLRLLLTSVRCAGVTPRQLLTCLWLDLSEAGAEPEGKTARCRRFPTLSTQSFPAGLVHGCFVDPQKRLAVASPKRHGSCRSRQLCPDPFRTALGRCGSILRAVSAWREAVICCAQRHKT